MPANLGGWEPQTPDIKSQEPADTALCAPKPLEIKARELAGPGPDALRPRSTPGRRRNGASTVREGPPGTPSPISVPVRRHRVEGRTDPWTNVGTTGPSLLAAQQLGGAQTTDGTGRQRCHEEQQARGGQRAEDRP